MKKNMQKRLAMIILATLFTLTICGAVSAAPAPTTTSLTISPSPAYVGDSVTLTAHLASGTNPVSNRVITFTSGTTSITKTTNSNGDASYTFTPHTVGTSTITASFSGGPAYGPSNDSATLTVNRLPTSMSVNSITGYTGDYVNLTATLTDTHNNVGVSGETVAFRVNGNNVGTATTDSNGVATLLNYQITQTHGSYNIRATFTQDSLYEGSNDTETLTVNRLPTSMSVNSTSGYTGDYVNLTATLTDTHNNVGVSGETVNFRVNGTLVGSATTDNNGVATLLNYQITQNPGSYNLRATFAQNIQYAASTDLGSLTVIPAASIDIQKDFRDYNGNVINSANYQDYIYSIVRVTNNGPDTATNVVIQDTPIGFTPNNYWVSYDNGSTEVMNDGSYDTATGVWTINNITNGTEYWLIVYGQITQTGTVTNTATETAQDQYSYTGYGSATATIDVQPAAAFTITKYFTSDVPWSLPAHISSANYQNYVWAVVQVTNNGPDASNIVIQDILHGLTQAVYDYYGTPFQYVIGYGGGWWYPDGSYNPITGVWNMSNSMWFSPTWASGETRQLAIYTQVNATDTSPNGPVYNEANETSQSAYQYTPDAYGRANLQVNAASDIAVTKTVNNTNPNVLDTIIYTLNVKNNGPDQATNVIVNDVLPAGLTYDHYVVTGYSGSAGLPTWDPNTRTFTIDGYYFDPNGYVTIDVYAIVGTILGGQHVDNTASLVSLDQYDWNTTNNASTVGIDVKPAADVGVIKDVNNSSPNIGEQLDYTIMAYNSNNSPNNATGVTVTDTIPAGLTYVGNDHPGSTIWDPINHVLTWIVGNLNIGQFDILHVWTTVDAQPQSPTITNNANITADEYDWNLTNNQDSETIYEPVADVQLNKTTSNTTPNVGQQFTYIITATNNGPQTATNVIVSDLIPAGLTINSVSFTGSGSQSYNWGTGVWWIVSISSGNSAQLIITVTPTSSVAGTNVTNTATKTAEDQYDPTTPDVASVSVHVPKVNITLQKAVNVTTQNVGQNVIYTLTASNAANADNATNVKINDILPAGLTFVSADGNYNSTTGQWLIDTLNAGSSAVLHITATVTSALAGQNVTNTAAYVGADQYDTNVGMTSNAQLYVPKADVQLNKTTSNSTPNVGQQFYYNVTATNNGPDDATGVQVIDSIPAGLTFNSYTASQGTYDNTTGIWNVGTILNGTNAWLQLFVTPIASVAGTNVTNTVTKTAQNEYDPTTPDNASVSVHVPLANVVVTKTSNGPVDVGNIGIFTITLHNNGPDAVHNVIVTDILPSGFTAGTPTLGSFSGNTWTIQTLDSGATATLNITGIITSAMGANITNNITETQNEYSELSHNATANIYVPHSSVYITTSAAPTNLTVGGTTVITVLVGNKGPDAADNVIASYTVPSGFDFVGVTQQAGYPAPQYNSANRTVTWNLGTLGVTDPYMYITLRAISPGTFDNLLNVTTTTYDPNTGNKTSSVTVNVQQPVVPNVNAASSRTVGMLPTGLPIAGLILAILSVFGGLVMPKRKN